MNGRENLQQILALVDMTKIDLPSYNISVKKYDAIASTYTRVIFLLAVLELRANKGEIPSTQEESERLGICSKTVTKIGNDPTVYSYEKVVQEEKELVGKAATTLYGGIMTEQAERFRRLQNEVKKSLMIKNMKEMLTSLHLFDENNTDDLIDFCMSEENFQRQLEAFARAQNKNAGKEAQEEVAENSSKEDETENITEPSPVDERQESKDANEECDERSTKKVSFWARLFRKK